MVRLGQAKAADPLAGGQLGQVLLLLRFGAEFIDRHHHQRRLHAHHRAVARIDALDFTGDQAVADIVQAGAAVLLGDGRAEQAQFAHLAEDLDVGLLVAERLQHARHQLVLAVRGGGVTHGAFVGGQLLVEQQGIGPVEFGVGSHAGLLRWRGGSGRLARVLPEYRVRWIVRRIFWFRIAELCSVELVYRKGSAVQQAKPQAT
ncbi:hypothetical protein D3C81_1180410 [compost metagenome]